MTSSTLHDELHDAPYNASDPRQVAGRKRAAKRRQKKDGDFLCRALKDAEGRSFFYELLAKCHSFRTTFTGEALSSAFSEGERNIGTQLYAMLMNADPKAFLLMLTEQGKTND